MVILTTALAGWSRVLVCGVVRVGLVLFVLFVLDCYLSVYGVHGVSLIAQSHPLDGSYYFHVVDHSKMLRMVAILRALAFLRRFLYYCDLLLLLVVLLGSAFLVANPLRFDARVGRYNLLRWRGLPQLRGIVTV